MLKIIFNIIVFLFCSLLTFISFVDWNFCYAFYICLASSLISFVMLTYNIKKISE